MTPLLRREGAEQCGLARPKGAAPKTDDDVQRKRFPRVADQREESEADRHHDQSATQDRPRPDPIGEGTAHEPRYGRGGGTRGDDQPSDPERDPAHVVQVNDQERSDDAVAEHVREPAGLKDPDVPRQLRVQAAKVAPHRASLTALTKEPDRAAGLLRRIDPAALA